jgi:hypothetical protein
VWLGRERESPEASRRPDRPLSKNHIKTAQESEGGWVPGKRFKPSESCCPPSIIRGPTRPPLLNRDGSHEIGRPTFQPPVPLCPKLSIILNNPIVDFFLIFLAGRLFKIILHLD